MIIDRHFTLLWFSTLSYGTQSAQGDLMPLLTHCRPWLLCWLSSLYVWTYTTGPAPTIHIFIWRWWKRKLSTSKQKLEGLTKIYSSLWVTLSKLLSEKNNYIQDGCFPDSKLIALLSNLTSTKWKFEWTNLLVLSKPSRDKLEGNTPLLPWLW